MVKNERELREKERIIVKLTSQLKESKGNTGKYCGEELKEIENRVRGIELKLKNIEFIQGENKENKLLARDLFLLCNLSRSTSNATWKIISILHSKNK